MERQQAKSKEGEMILGSESAMDAVLFGAPSQATVEYFRNKINNLSTTLNDYVGTGMEWIKNQATNVFNSFYSDNAVRAAQDILRSTANHFRDDILHRVYVNDFHPNLITQKFLMACPAVWERNLKGITDNFGGTYYDPEPDIKDITLRDDYIKVMDGIVQFDKNGEGFSYQYTVTTDDVELSLEDRLTIMDNWIVAKAIIANDDDPTRID